MPDLADLSDLATLYNYGKTRIMEQSNLIQTRLNIKITIKLPFQKLQKAMLIHLVVSTTSPLHTLFLSFITPINLSSQYSPLPCQILKVVTLVFSTQCMQTTGLTENCCRKLVFSA